jgi:asparagine synthase (glutamine-hydrolysing)
MCGISGIYGLNDKLRAETLIQQMNQTMSHRGPDGEGIYCDEKIALGHRRLAILDLSNASAQPMHSHDKNFEIVFNGEIYNFQAIKKNLSEVSFKTRSDTEVILAAYQKWGKDCLHYFNGMFAFAIWDKKKHELFIARDRLGVKPLYYYFKDNLLFFASEIRTLLANGVVPRRLNKEALSDFFRHQTVHAPATMIKDVKVLMPGHHLVMNNNGMQIKKWWGLKENIRQDLTEKTYTEVCSDIHDLLLQSVESRLVSDVPFGAFLSGGIDSSIIVGIMSEIQQLPVETFNIAFEEKEYSEANYAKQVATLFNTNHHELRLNSRDFLDELPNAMAAYDHPSGDGLNLYTVAKFARKSGVTMALSGLGSDELFAGYPVFKRSIHIEKLRWLWKTPLGLRKLIGHINQGIKPGTRAEKLLQLLELNNVDLKNTYPLSRQSTKNEILKELLTSNYSEQHEIRSIFEDAQIGNRHSKIPLLSQVSIAELSSYLSNILLRDTDQMSMAVALEVRDPFLDYRLVEYVLGVNDTYKKPLSPKKLLVDSLEGLLPNSIVQRKKMGFVFPWALWLRRELRQFCEKKILSFSQRNIVDSKTLLAIWEMFLKDHELNLSAQVWLCVLLEDWIERNQITT